MNSIRPLGWLGVVLIVIGGIVVAMRGVSYTKHRNDVELGPVHIVSDEKGFVPPGVGLVAIGLGAALFFVARRRG